MRLSSALMKSHQFRLCREKPVMLLPVIEKLYAGLKAPTNVMEQSIYLRHWKLLRDKFTARRQNTKKVDFEEFLNDLLREMPEKSDVQYHIIMDNYCTHKNLNDWLLVHPNVHFHYTPTSASWLNMVEIWFNIMSRKVLCGASHNSISELTDAIKKYIEAYNENVEPFRWKKREVYGS